MKKIFSFIIMALAVISTVSAQYEFSSTAADTRARVASGKITMMNTQNVQLVPKANMYLLQDLKDPAKFYVAVSLDDSLRHKVMNKGNKIFFAYALEIDKPQAQIILRDFKNKLDFEIKMIKEEADQLKTKPEKEKKIDKKKRMLELAKKLTEFAEAKRDKQKLIDEFSKMIEDQGRSTRIYRIFHSQILDK